MHKLGLNKGAVLVVISYLAFISLGLPDGLLGIAWPFMSLKHQVPLDSLGVLLVSFTLGYLLASVLSGKVMARFHLGVLLTVSCAITSVSLLGYAFASHWYVVVCFSFFLGMGGGAIDSAINTFAASRFSASVVNWLHAFYGVGATSGPLILTALLSQGKAWHLGYVVVGLIQLSLTILFMSTLRFWHTAPEQSPSGKSVPFKNTLVLPIVWCNLVIFFVYVGLEVGVGQWLFSILTKSRKVSVESAGLYTSAYWGSLTLGRILFGLILTKISVPKVLYTAFIGILISAVLIFLNLHNYVTLLGIISIGFCNAPIFPSLISLTPTLVGVQHTANAVGFQISAAMIGGALLPGLAGVMSEQFDLEVIPVMYVLFAVLLLVAYVISRSLTAAKTIFKE